MGAESFQKREREKRKRERAAEKQERRVARQDSDDTGEAVDTDALFERYRVISEQHAAGQLDAEAYEAERLEIFTALGVATSDD